MTFSFVRRNDRASTKGLARINIVVRHDGKPYKVPTGIKCSSVPAAWNEEKQVVNSKFNNAAVINDRLKKAKAVFEQVLNELEVFNIELIRQKFDLHFRASVNSNKAVLAKPKQIAKEPELKYWIDTEEPYDFKKKWEFEHHEQFARYTPIAQKFYALIEYVIHEFRNQWSDSHKKKYRSLRSKLIGNIHDPMNNGKRKYEGMDDKFWVSKISLSWWQDYVDYCFDDLENEHNTVQTDLKALLQFCDIIKKRGISFNENIYDASMEYIEPRIEPLEWNEVRAIAELDLSDFPQYEDSRYMWVACAYLGQRWRDMKRITHRSFISKNVEENGKLVKKKFYVNRQQKTKKLIEVPLLPEAEDWLSRRDFELPEISQQQVNRCIKVIARMARINQTVVRHKVVRGQAYEEFIPKWRTVHIHTARHSFAVEIVKRSLDEAYRDKIVSDMLGHASPQTTWKYVNFVSSQKEKLFLKVIANTSYNNDGKKAIAA
jgi:integrase